MPIDQRSDRPFDPSASEPSTNTVTAASETTLSNPPISPELALVDPVVHRVAPLGHEERQEAHVIDNGNPDANGNGAVAQLVVPPAAGPHPPAAAETSPETLLFRTGLLSPDQLGELVQERVSSGRAVEEIVVERGWLDAATVAQALGGAAAAAPAVESHPDPFALPVVEPAVFELSAEPAPVAEPTSDLFPPPDESVPIEPVALQPVEPQIASFAAPVIPTPIEPDQEPAPAVAEPQVVEPQPIVQVVQAQPVDDSSAGVEFRVSIRFVGNECVEVGSHAGADEAKAAAASLVAQLSSERGEWPFVGGRFVRADAVLSVDIDAVVR